MRNLVFLLIVAGLTVLPGLAAGADDQVMDAVNAAEATDNAKITNTNEFSAAQDDSTAISGRSNVVANDDSRIGDVNYAVSSADLELVNIVGTTNANILLDHMQADEMRDIHISNDVGIQAANFTSGNFNNQAIQAQITVSVSKPGFLNPTSSSSVP